MTTPTHLFQDPSYVSPFKSHHYKPWHMRYQQRFRQFLENNIIPYSTKWDEAGGVPSDIYKQIYNKGFYSFSYPSKYGGQLFEGHSGDAFSTLIRMNEIAKAGSGGVYLTIWGTMDIAIPLLLQFGSEAQKNKYVKPVLTADKIICLAITEPSAGSDVSAIKTVATDDPNDANYLRVSGQKRFITNGNKANYYLTAVKYKNNVMVLVIDKDFVNLSSDNGKFISTEIKTMGIWASDTAHIIMDNVKVPKTNIIKSHKLNGFQMFMLNFNYERFRFAAFICGTARVCLNESVKYAKKRKTFGKYLINHQVIRHKLVDMIQRIEVTHSMTERVADLINYGEHNKSKIIKDGNYKEYMQRLSCLCALTRNQASQTVEFCARESVQIFGGNGYIRSGQATKIERIYRDAKIASIGAGTEEVLVELIANQSKL
eukprot:192169_1